MRTLTHCETCGEAAKGAHRLYCGKTGVDVPKFWAKMDKQANGCWIWTGGKYNHGYGSVVWRFSPKGRGKMIAASRAAWMVTHGPIPEGMQVCHRCDVPACCNPEHLFLGTITDNMRDMRSKGRRAMGEATKRHKLTEATVRTLQAIPPLFKEEIEELAAKYGVKPQTILNAALGRTWSYLK